MDFAPYPGIHLNDEEGTRIVREVVGEAPVTSETFQSLRRAMAMETFINIEALPEGDSN